VTSKTPHALRWWIGLSALAIVALDQGTKWWAESTLELREYVPVLGDLLGWRLIYNPGAAFGLASSMTWILTIVAAVAVVALVVLSLRATRVSLGIGLAGMLGGAISHLGNQVLARVTSSISSTTQAFLSATSPTSSWSPPRFTSCY
jgi:signal peptidase II